MSRPVVEVWTNGAHVVIYASKLNTWEPESYYFACETCGMCSRHSLDRADVEGLGKVHAENYDHSQYERTEAPCDD